MKKTYIIVFFAAATLFAATGALYQIKCMPRESVSSYISSFAQSLENGVSCKNIFVNSFRGWLLIAAVIFVCGFFRFGFLVSFFAAAKRLFTAGFTAAAFVCAFKAKGILAAAVLEFPLLTALLPLSILCCASAAMSFKRGDKGIKNIRAYILVTIGAILVFFGSALCEGYVVTRLLKIILGG